MYQIPLYAQILKKIWRNVKLGEMIDPHMSWLAGEKGGGRRGEWNEAASHHENKILDLCSHFHLKDIDELNLWQNA